MHPYRQATVWKLKPVTLNFSLPYSKKSLTKFWDLICTFLWPLLIKWVDMALIMSNIYEVLSVNFSAVSGNPLIVLPFEKTQEGKQEWSNPPYWKSL